MGINELLGNAGSRGVGNELVSCPGEEVIHKSLHAMESGVSSHIVDQSWLKC